MSSGSAEWPRNKADLAKAALRSAFIALAVSGGLAGCAGGMRGPDGSGGPELSAEERELDVRSFDLAWTTIRDAYFDSTLAGLDWDGVSRELRPKVERSRTREETRAIIREMISKLGGSHGGIVPAEDYETGREGEGGGETGMEIRRVQDRMTVTRVMEGSPAEAAGIEMGWIVTKVRGLDVDSLVAALDARLEDRSWKEETVISSVYWRMYGTAGEIVRAVFLDRSDGLVEKALVLAPGRGEIAPKPADAAPCRVWFESRLTPDGIGYVRFNLFEGPAFMMSRFNEAIGSFLDARGVVIDLRGNGGGLGAMAVWMAGWFVSEPGRSLGIMQTRKGSEEIPITPRAVTFKGPVALMLDETSASTAELFAQGLKDIGRAAIVGRRSAGASLPSDILRLPNGDRLVYPVARHLSAATREPVEDRGVVPDLEVVLRRNALLQGRDETFERAVDWIMSRENPSISGD